MKKINYIQCPCCSFANFGKPVKCVSCGNKFIYDQVMPQEQLPIRHRGKKREIEIRPIGKHVFKKQPDNYVPYKFS